MFYKNVAAIALVFSFASCANQNSPLRDENQNPEKSLKGLFELTELEYLLKTDSKSMDDAKIRVKNLIDKYLVGMAGKEESLGPDIAEYHRTKDFGKWWEKNGTAPLNIHPFALLQHKDENYTIDRYLVASTSGIKTYKLPQKLYLDSRVNSQEIVDATTGLEISGSFYDQTGQPNFHIQRSKGPTIYITDGMSDSFTPERSAAPKVTGESIDSNEMIRNVLLAQRAGYLAEDYAVPYKEIVNKDSNTRTVHLYSHGEKVQLVSKEFSHNRKALMTKMLTVVERELAVESTTPDTKEILDVLRQNLKWHIQHAIPSAEQHPIDN
jgi:hypothetical protein